ncbi:transducin beta-like protein TBL1, partial [Toxoplasma gondii MAS]
VSSNVAANQWRRQPPSCGDVRQRRTHLRPAVFNRSRFAHRPSHGHSSHHMEEHSRQHCVQRLQHGPDDCGKGRREAWRSEAGRLCVNADCRAVTRCFSSLGSSCLKPTSPDVTPCSPPSLPSPRFHASRSELSRQTGASRSESAAGSRWLSGQQRAVRRHTFFFRGILDRKKGDLLLLQRRWPPPEASQEEKGEKGARAASRTNVCVCVCHSAVLVGCLLGVLYRHMKKNLTDFVGRFPSTLLLRECSIARDEVSESRHASP